jgi:hypothetical protein
MLFVADRISTPCGSRDREDLIVRTIRYAAWTGEVQPRLGKFPRSPFFTGTWRQCRTAACQDSRLGHNLLFAFRISKLRFCVYSEVQVLPNLVHMP